MIRRALRKIIYSLQAEYWKVLAARKTPIPFTFRKRRYYSNPEIGAAYHIRNSTEKLARMCDVIDRAPKVVFDVGANCGLFSTFISERFPDCRIFAFEPSADLIPIIRLNCASPRMTICEHAVGSLNGEQSFFINRESQQTNSARKEAVNLFAGDSAVTERVVPCRTLDSVAEEFGVSSVDILKVDVQGCEGDVFRGARRILPHVRSLFVESTWMDVESITQLIPFAIKVGFTHAAVINPVYMGADILLSREPISSNLRPNLLTVQLCEALSATRWS